jgi:hypothetical protein
MQFGRAFQIGWSESRVEDLWSASCEVRVLEDPFDLIQIARKKEEGAACRRKAECDDW